MKFLLIAGRHGVPLPHCKGRTIASVSPNFPTHHHAHPPRENARTRQSATLLQLEVQAVSHSALGLELPLESIEQLGHKSKKLPSTGLGPLSWASRGTPNR